jgi:hypothetical protein
MLVREKKFMGILDFWLLQVRMPCRNVCCF